MSYWLYKTEPSTWSWDDQLKAGANGTQWTGVRNHQAKANLKAMKKGDRGFFYHTGDEKAVVGIVEVTKEYYPDPTDKSGMFGMVDLKAVKPLKRPVTLAQIKAEPKLKGMVLVNNSRLSVQPVSDGEWTLVSKLGGL